jgi:hypothetical protein
MSVVHQRTVYTCINDNIRQKRERRDKTEGLFSDRRSFLDRMSFFRQVFFQTGGLFSGRRSFFRHEVFFKTGGLFSDRRSFKKTAVF